MLRAASSTIYTQNKFITWLKYFRLLSWQYQYARMTNFGSIVFIMEDSQPLVPLYGTGFLNNEFPFQKFFFCATKRD